MFNYFNTHWTDSLRDYIAVGHSLVMITVVNVEGSAPRESSCRMFVMTDQIVETIGGGNLEHEAINLARSMLASKNENNYRLELYGLGPALQQCCGGAVTLAFEKITAVPDWLAALEGNAKTDEILVTEYGDTKAERFITTYESLNVDDQLDNVLIERLQPLMPEVVVFGGGHVGNALVDALSRLPFKVNWVDERDDLFANQPGSNVKIYTGKSALDFIDILPDNALNIVMTHSHELDEEICYQYLQQKQFRFLGLIGSRTKRARFLHRLRDRGINQTQLANLTCPIGVSEVTGSSPPEIAIAVCAQLLNVRDQIKLNTSLL